MSEPPEVMRRAADRLDALFHAGRVPAELALAMRTLGLASEDHVAECVRCRKALQRAAPGLPDRTELCPVLVSLWEGLGQLGSLVVDPDTGELGPLARRVES